MQLLNTTTHLLQNWTNYHEGISKNISKKLYVSRKLLTLLTYVLSQGIGLYISKFQQLSPFPSLIRNLIILQRLFVLLFYSIQSENFS